MAKPLNKREIEAARRRSGKAERREQIKRQLHEEIAQSRGDTGVIVIPPRERQTAAQQEPAKLRVAAYVRVSTQEDEQIGSYEMQILHFQQRIESNPMWELAKIYKDEGVSGTSVKKREGFQAMIADAVDGKIDLILTKSINRFGRNIVDILDNLRTLSGLTPPVTVEFETEGITYSGDGQHNFLIAILSALAELESQQKSEAIKAGIRWRMAEGIYRFSVHNTLGYYRDHFGRLVIEPTEAKIVQYIYDSCIEGATVTEIAYSLTEQGISTPMGKEVWNPSTVRSILTNEKYCGDALMQKTYVKDFREHRSVKNTDLNMYFKENHHAAIIERDQWNRVQEILAHQYNKGKGASLRRLADSFVVRRVKGGVCKGYYILDPNWTPKERREFLAIIQSIQITTQQGD